MKITCVSLGCDKNLVDTERMLGIVLDAGCTFTDDPADADVAIINTCCFIDAAKDESIAAILDMAELKHTGDLKALIVTGCMAERYRSEIIKEIPEVDAVVGTASIAEIGNVIREALDKKSVEVFLKQGEEPDISAARVITTGDAYE